MIARFHCGLLQFVLLCSAIYAERRTAVQLQARFDAGPVNSCEIPNTTICSVDFSVPTSVASLTPVIEEEIQNQYKVDNESSGLVCAQALREIRCVQRFPRCSEDGTQVTLSSLNCTEMVSVCPSLIQNLLQEEGFCTLGGTSRIGECQPVTEYGYQFRHCPMGSSDSWCVTRWMYNIMMHVDVQLVARFSGTLGNADSECRRKYATYFCQFMGRCTSDQEPRVEVVNTYELCEEVVNCFSDFIANQLRKTLACNQWPHQLGLLVPVSSPPPVVSVQTTEPPSGSISSSDDSTPRTRATTITNPTWPNPTWRIDPFPDGVASLHSVCLWALLFLTIFATLGGL